MHGEVRTSGKILTGRSAAGCTKGQMGKSDGCIGRAHVCPLCSGFPHTLGPSGRPVTAFLQGGGKRLDPSPGAAPIGKRVSNEVIPVTQSQAYLLPSEAARLLGVSSKALRLYEERGFVRTVRDAAGRRHYGPDEIARLRQVVAMRGLGLSLAQIGSVLGGAREALATALVEHQGQLELQIAGMHVALEQVKLWRQDLRNGRVPDVAKLNGGGPAVSLTLPWPWAGETLEIRRLAPVTYLVGPLGSGKTRLAMSLATALGGTFYGLDRPGPETLTDAAETALAWLNEDGATASEQLCAVVAAIHGDPKASVLDLIENGLDGATQLALGAWLRRRSPAEKPLIVMTRSSAILDLDAVSPGHAILYCPANHTPPFEVVPVAGTPGYESLASCLGTPEARARTAGMMVSIA